MTLLSHDFGMMTSHMTKKIAIFGIGRARDTRAPRAQPITAYSGRKFSRARSAREKISWRLRRRGDFLYRENPGREIFFSLKNVLSLNQKC